MREESYLRKLGYNVNKTDNLPTSLRWHILESAVDNMLLTKSQICSHLDYLVNTNYMKDTHIDAIAKWEDDRRHIADYTPKSKMKMKVYMLTAI